MRLIETEKNWFENEMKIKEAIRTAETFHGPGYLTVADAMTEAPYTVQPEAPLCEVLETLIQRKIGSALVTSPRGVVIGIFTTADALHLLRSLALLGSRERDDSETAAMAA